MGDDPDPEYREFLKERRGRLSNRLEEMQRHIQESSVDADELRQSLNAFTPLPQSGAEKASH